MQVLLASNNTAKLRELQALFADLGVRLVAQAAAGIGEVDEPFGTFVENALAKARHAARFGGGPALADDSGLCVDALGGRPGVASAHFASDAVPPGAGGDREARRALQDAANNALLLQQLRGAADRRAAFVCTLVALRHADDPEPLIASARWPGEVLHAARGTGGFGYDPLLLVPALGATVAELPAAVKNARSHRAQAAALLRAQLREAWHLGR